MKTIEILQPKPYDLVNNTILIAGNATAFEGTLSIYISDGVNEFTTTAQVGALGLEQFQAKITIPNNIQFNSDTLTITATDDTALDPGDPNIPIVKIPVLFAPNILENYYGYWFYQIKPGDTLGKIAQEFYDDPSMWNVLYRANIHTITDPNIIQVGDILRIPRAN